MSGEESTVYVILHRFLEDNFIYILSLFIGDKEQREVEVSKRSLQTLLLVDIKSGELYS